MRAGASTSADVPAAARAHGFGGTQWLIVAWALAVTVVAVFTAEPDRVVALPSVIATIVTWGAALIVVTLRAPRGQIRISDPGVLVLLWAGYYFLLPAISWLQAKQLFLEDVLGLAVSPEAMMHAQGLHLLFLVVFATSYCVIVKRFGFVPLSIVQVNECLPRARWVILAGSVPMLLEVIRRLVTTGSIAPDMEYGLAMSVQQNAIDASRASGGLDYLLTQIQFKTQFYGVIVLGIGLGLIFVRAWKTRNWWILIAFHVAAPLWMLMSGGSRSTAIFPFLIALLLSDLIAGPIPWRYLLTIALAGYAFFWFYGFFRANQSVDLSSALSATISDIGEARELDLAEAENSAMLLKEAWAIDRVDSVGESGIPRYLFDLVTSPVPQQILENKPPANSEFLTREMVGDALADSGFGVAGSTVVEGYLAGSELGVAVVAMVLGLLAGFVVQTLGVPKGGARSVPFWRIALLATTLSQAVAFIRGDAGGLVVYALYYVLVPIVILTGLVRAGKMRRWDCLIEAAE